MNDLISEIQTVNIVFADKFKNVQVIPKIIMRHPNERCELWEIRSLRGWNACDALNRFL